MYIGCWMSGTGTQGGSRASVRSHGSDRGRRKASQSTKQGQRHGSARRGTHSNRKSEDRNWSDEKRYLHDVVRHLSSYQPWAEWFVRVLQEDFQVLPKRQRMLVPMFQDKLNGMRKCVRANQVVEYTLDLRKPSQHILGLRAKKCWWFYFTDFP